MNHTIITERVTLTGSLSVALVLRSYFLVGSTLMRGW